MLVIRGQTGSAATRAGTAARATARRDRRPIFAVVCVFGDDDGSACASSSTRLETVAAPSLYAAEPRAHRRRRCHGGVDMDCTVWFLFPTHGNGRNVAVLKSLGAELCNLSILQPANPTARIGKKPKVNYLWYDPKIGRPHVLTSACQATWELPVGPSPAEGGENAGPGPGEGRGAAWNPWDGEERIR